MLTKNKLGAWVFLLVTGMLLTFQACQQLEVADEITPIAQGVDPQSISPEMTVNLELNNLQINELTKLGFSFKDGKYGYDLEQFAENLDLAENFHLKNAKNGRRGVEILIDITGAWHDPGSIDALAFATTVNALARGRLLVDIPVYIPGIGSKYDDILTPLDTNFTDQETGNQVLEEMISFVIHRMKIIDHKLRFIGGVSKWHFKGHSWGGVVMQRLIGDPRFQGLAIKDERFGTATWHNAFVLEQGESLLSNAPWYIPITEGVAVRNPSDPFFASITLPVVFEPFQLDLAAAFFSNAVDSTTGANLMDEIFTPHVYVPFYTTIPDEVLEQFLVNIKEADNVYYLDYEGDLTMIDPTQGALSGFGADGLPLASNRPGEGTAWFFLYGTVLKDFVGEEKFTHLLEPMGSHEIGVMFPREVNDGVHLFTAARSYVKDVTLNN